MENTEFSKLLLRIAFASTVVDGEIDNREIDIIRNLQKEDFYLKEFDLNDELDQIQRDASQNPSDYSNNILKQTYNLDLTPSQKLIMINLAIAVVRADNVMQEQEIVFIKNLILNLQIPDSIVDATNGNWWIISDK